MADAGAMRATGGKYEVVNKLVKLPDFLLGIKKLFVNLKTLPAGPFFAYLATAIEAVPPVDIQVTPYHAEVYFISRWKVSPTTTSGSGADACQIAHALWPSA